MSCQCSCASSECWCDERVPEPPLPTENRPGLPAIRRRVATHATAKAAMLHALSDPTLPATNDLTARTDADFAIALADAAAVTIDVLTFYTERYVNEHYLRTATERRSIIELSRLLGYQPQPGLAATADVTFTLEEAPGAPAQSVIPSGTGVQSSPDPGQDAVVYETLADLVARPVWNAMRPRPRVPHPEPAASSVVSLAFAGLVSSVAPGDGVLFRTGDDSAAVAFGVIRTVQAVDAVPPQPGKPSWPARTEITVSVFPTKVAQPSQDSLLPQNAGMPAFPSSVSWLADTSMTAEELDARLLARSATLDDIAGPLAQITGTSAYALLFRQQRALFGSQAPLASSIAAAVANETGPIQITEVKSWAASLVLPWESATVATFPNSELGDVFVDGATPAIAIDSLLVLRDGPSWGVYHVTSAAPISVAALGITGRASKLQVTPTSGLDSFSIRGTAAFAAPESIALADVPAPEPLDPATIELDGLMLGLRSGRPVVVQGEPMNDAGHQLCVSTTLKTVVHDFSALTTSVTLGDQLPTQFRRRATTIAGNVVKASHGQTRTEILGSGDGRATFQRFALRQPPLTYLSSASPSGLLTTLQVWVGDVRWTAVDSFQDSGPHDRVYVAREQDGVSVVQFGDGVTGARLPSGTANVRAVYRSGSGLVGRVHAAQLTLPMARAGGVTGVINPAASVGGDDPETVDSARISAPLRVTTLDRVVSMADYALFARAFPGVAKAVAVWARAADHRGVLLTVAGSHGDVLVSSQGIGQNLLAALNQYGDPLVPVSLIPYSPRSFRFAANVVTASDLDRDTVLAAASARVMQTFSFEVRDLGQSVYVSEILAEIQAVEGIVAAIITKLWVFDPAHQTNAPPGPPPEVLPANGPAPGADISTLRGADLIILDAAPISWGVMP
jgi:predicted phage baseplate assembly protein